VFCGDFAYDLTGLVCYGRRPLYAPDWVPADQPTRDDEQGYYWKMRL
jgi:hypothetical protein